VPSQWFYHQAIKIEQISLVMPLTALLPLLLFTSFVFFGGWSWVGALGVLVVTSGVYFLEITKNFKTSKDKLSFGNLLGPIKAISKNKASRYMLVTVLLWSITTPLQKVAVGQSNIAFMGVCYLSGCSILIILQRIISRQSVAKVVLPAGVWRVIPVGLFAGLGSIAQYSALSFLSPVYVISLKDTILLWSVLWDKMVFHKTITRAQMISIIIVTVGSIMVGISIIL
jgi:drug/metabolite transporter (DMT)-like permease